MVVNHNAHEIVEYHLIQYPNIYLLFVIHKREDERRFEQIIAIKQPARSSWYVIINGGFTNVQLLIIWAICNSLVALVAPRNINELELQVTLSSEWLRFVLVAGFMDW